MFGVIKKKKEKKGLGGKVKLISGKPNRRRFWFRPFFYLPQNGKPFRKEINLAKRPCSPHKTTSRTKFGLEATGSAALSYALARSPNLVGNLRELSLTSLAQNRPTIHKQFCLSDVKQPLAKIVTSSNLSQMVNNVMF